MTEAPPGRPASLPSREVLWYALGSAPSGIGILAWNFLVFYYNQVVGFSGSVIGAAALLVSVFDALTDPVVGTLSDRTRGRLGRRHPFLLLAAVPSGLLFFGMFALPPGFSTGALLAWLLVLHLVKRLIDTFFYVPYLALGAEISSDHEERTHIATMRSVFFNVGRASAGGILLLVFLRPTEAYPDGQMNPDGYVAFGATMSVVIAVLLWSSAWRTRVWIERLSSAPAAVSRSLRQVFREYADALRHRSFRAVLFASVARHIAWGAADALGLFMATFFWQVSTDLLFVWALGMFLGLFTGLPFWRAMAARVGKKRVAIAGDLLYLFFFCTPYLMKIAGFWPDNESPLYVPLWIVTTGFLAHFGNAAAGPMLGSMLGDVTDEDELATGRRREGVIFGAESFAWKALTGLGPLMAGLVIDAVGLSDRVDPADVAPEVVTALGLAQGGLMVAFFALALFLVRRYDLDRARHARILLELEARRRDEATAGG